MLRERFEPTKHNNNNTKYKGNSGELYYIRGLVWSGLVRSGHKAKQHLIVIVYGNKSIRIAGVVLDICSFAWPSLKALWFLALFLVKIFIHN